MVSGVGAMAVEALRPVDSTVEGIEAVVEAMHHTRSRVLFCVVEGHN